MWLCVNLVPVIAHLMVALQRSFLVRNNLSFRFYKPRIKIFQFLDFKPEVFHKGLSDIHNAQLIVLEGHILLRSDTCVFLLFARNFGTHTALLYLPKLCSAILTGKGYVQGFMGEIGWEAWALVWQWQRTATKRI